MAALCALATAAVKLMNRKPAMAGNHILGNQCPSAAANSHKFPLGILIIASLFYFPWHLTGRCTM